MVAFCFLNFSINIIANFFIICKFFHRACSFNHAHPCWVQRIVTEVAYADLCLAYSFCPSTAAYCGVSPLLPNVLALFSSWLLQYQNMIPLCLPIGEIIRQESNLRSDRFRVGCCHYTTDDWLRQPNFAIASILHFSRGANT